MSTIQRLVLIDDEPGVLRALGLLLQTMQFQVLPFSSPSEAIELIRTTTDIDLVVTDLRMPEISGYEVVQVVRDLRPQLPVIVMSGHATYSDVQALRSQGASAFISKPFTPTQFKTALDSAADQANPI